MSKKIDQDHNLNRSDAEGSNSFNAEALSERQEDEHFEPDEAYSEAPQLEQEEQVNIGIILFDVGNPMSEAEIEPFLSEVFNDPNLVTSLSPSFWAEKYLLKIQPYGASYLARYFSKQLKQAFPGIVWGQFQEVVQQQARLLEECLDVNGHRVKVLPTSRYGTPSIEGTLNTAYKMGLDKLILLPLVPQFSWLTTGSFLQAFDLALDELDLREDMTIRSIPHFYNNEFYIMALSQQIEQALEESFDESIRYQVPLMFVARGIPEKMIREHDPYEHHLEQTMDSLLESLGVPNPVYLTYQGQLSPFQWMGPQVKNMINYLAEKDIPGLLFIPLGWSSEQFETQILDQEVVAHAIQKGISPLHRLKTLNVNNFFISALKQALIDDLHVIKNTSLTKT